MFFFLFRNPQQVMLSGKALWPRDARDKCTYKCAYCCTFFLWIAPIYSTVEEVPLQPVSHSSHWLTGIQEESPLQMSKTRTNSEMTCFNKNVTETRPKFRLLQIKETLKMGTRLNTSIEIWKSQYPLNRLNLTETENIMELDPGPLQLQCTSIRVTPAIWIRPDKQCIDCPASLWSNLIWGDRYRTIEQFPEAESSKRKEVKGSKGDIQAPKHYPTWLRNPGML